MRHKPAYRPASLVQGRTRWYIKVYAPERERLTFGLNRILNLNLRRERGEEIVSLINWWLKADQPLDTFDERTARRRKNEAARAGVAPRGHTSILKAIYHAVDIKTAKTRATSSDSYRSHANVFAAYLEKADITAMPVDELETYHIMDFIDHRQLVDQVRNNTVNNNIINMGALFTELKERGFIVENYWHKIKKLPREKKKRRAFSLEEARVAIQYFFEKDPLLCLAILFQYCCIMRPNEIRQLHTNDVSLDTGVVRILPEAGKTSKNIHTRYATIPLSYEQLFRKLMPQGRGYIFGEGFKLANTPCNKNRMYKRHKRGLKEMAASGMLSRLEGLEFYSWKDTGTTHAANQMDILFVRDQAGHTDTNTTLKYYEKPKVNKHFREMDNILI